MKTNPKLKMARRMMTLQEKRRHVPPFSCAGWMMHKYGIANRVASARHRAAIRKDLKASGLGRIKVRETAQKTLEEVKAEAMKDPKFAAGYNALTPKPKKISKAKRILKALKIVK